MRKNNIKAAVIHIKKTICGCKKSWSPIVDIKDEVASLGRHETG
jgi:hypothetical protein